MKKVERKKKRKEFREKKKNEVKTENKNEDKQDEEKMEEKIIERGRGRGRFYRGRRGRSRVAGKSRGIPVSRGRGGKIEPMEVEDEIFGDEEDEELEEPIIGRKKKRTEKKLKQKEKQEKKMEKKIKKLNSGSKK